MFPRLLFFRQEILKSILSCFRNFGLSSEVLSFCRPPPLPSVLFMAFSDSRSKNSEIERGGGGEGGGTEGSNPIAASSLLLLSLFGKQAFWKWERGSREREERGGEDGVNSQSISLFLLDSQRLFVKG